MMRKMAFGEVLGHSPLPHRIPAYSSDYGSAKWFTSLIAFNLSSYFNIPGRAAPVYGGFKWQCVEYARRYLVLVHGVSFPSVGMAWEIFENLESFETVETADKSTPRPVKITKHRDGSTVPPEAEDVLIWRRELRGTGHVAIITKVDDSSVCICEQNWEDEHWEGRDYGRRVRLEVRDGKYYIIDPYITGWIKVAYGDKSKSVE